jgi:2,3-bisphosphoglycerate-independent phosphoglycerate mutase
MTMARVVADRGLGQLHVAESEKYPHVTYFFNGGEETPYPGEERRLVPSPRDVPTYDHKPEMSARSRGRLRGVWSGRAGLRDHQLRQRRHGRPHGSIPAAVRPWRRWTPARGVVDAVRATGGACIVTADHGNADHMLEPTGRPTPLTPSTGAVRHGRGRDRRALRRRILADVAPTALALLGFDSRRDDGRSLLG